MLKYVIGKLHSHKSMITSLKVSFSLTTINTRILSQDIVEVLRNLDNLAFYDSQAIIREWKQ